MPKTGDESVDIAATNCDSFKQRHTGQDITLNGAVQYEPSNYMRLHPVPDALSVPSLPGYHLPELQVVLPIVQTYFVCFNSMLPLFHEGRFMRMLMRWYSVSHERFPAPFAAINVVLALSLWQDSSRKSPEDDRFMRQCIQNAQSVLCSLVTREQDLMGIQAVLGLVMLFIVGPNPRPAAALIAIAFKLAHRLRLHTRSSREMFDDSAALERDRVFWIMYVLEREMSVRLKDPYLQQDDDMDVALPEFNDLNDKSSIIFAGDGRAWLNFLLCRTDLARIQARICHCIYSVRAEKFTVDEREAAMTDLDSTVHEWKQSIPLQFQPDMLSDRSFGTNLRYLVHLHFIYYHCYYLAHGIYAHDPDWMRRVTTYSDRYSGRPAVISDTPWQESPLPATWVEDVKTAKETMRLFKVVHKQDLALLGQISCTYLTSMVILIINKLTICELALHNHLDSDDMLIDEGLIYLDRIAGTMDNDRLRSLYKGCLELRSRAAIAMIGYNGLENLWMPDEPTFPWSTTKSISALFESFATADMEGPTSFTYSGMWPQDVANLVDTETYE
ncbi:hypothetical protein LTR99_003176 [Exophiala xenobiotica]|uniref:Xylanolytic transcriptional activator regulatory domain-containing protein n=1 Tax=Vermiconidia calcicola TaxID=1690605 RepID=A0AAV9QCT8_9PEZI|nr:hypothetical protein LTR96_006789 [Exophiala xenobiotica]KAK5535498.1 hypothetical protein LTR23_008378 [Chaetothyriales sp. CCFEE 6169]KAK5538842.1 hypothetical protein LTR25_004386 [Vermiconidia calcicola]KAK5305632.1 hypothetical protein LTR99_003176 [Exophiala xenobiotica]KAK5335977.1 hypothetical protein LTR98_008193 [Exophiala xenobiotica]